MPDNTKITHPVALDATLQNVATNIRGLSQTLTPAVDDNMSTVSTNPVQNKVVTAAVNDKVSTVSMTKQDDGTRKLTFTKGNGTTSEYDLTYPTANASNPGLESSAHYTKLEGIAAGAEVNQNAFSSFTGENGEIISATSKQDSIEIHGVNIDIDFNPGGEGLPKVITFTGNTGGGEDWNVALDGTVDYSKPSDNYLEIYHENFPYTDEHPEELTFSINQYDLLTNFNDIDINENGSDISQIQIHKGCYTTGGTSALEAFYRYNFKHSHLCPYNNKEYKFYYYAYKNNTGYKYEIWTDNESLIFNATENKFYVASYGGETYEASLSGDYPDAFIYDKIGTRYTYNGNFNIDNGSLFIYNPSVSADVSGINALYNYYSENFPTFKLITDFKKGVMYDYYFYIPYYYPTLSYMLNDQIDLDGNTVHAEFVVKGGAETPSTGDEVLVKRHFYRGAPLVIDINDEGYSPEYITYTSDFLSKVNIFADEQENYVYQWFEDDSRVAGNYQLSMHIEYPKFDPYNYLTKDEAANTYLNKNDVDANMSTVSTNPVQNAVVTTAVNNNISTVSMTKSNDGTRKLTFEKGNGSTFEHDLSYAQATDSVLGLVKVNGSTGTSTTDVMSQKAVTDELSAIKNITDNFTIENGELCILVDEQNNGGSSNGTVSKAISLNETLQDIADTLDGMSDNIDSVAASTAAETTTNWLNQHVDPQSQTIIDDSLTISGAAADAKVTGDNVRELKSALTSFEKDSYNLFDIANITVLNGNFNIGTLKYNPSATSKCFILPCTAGVRYYVSRKNATSRLGITFTETEIDGTAQADIIGGDSLNNANAVNALAPVGANYLIVYYYNGNYDNDEDATLEKMMVATQSDLPYVTHKIIAVNEANLNETIKQNILEGKSAYDYGIVKRVRLDNTNDLDGVTQSGLYDYTAASIPLNTPNLSDNGIIIVVSPNLANSTPPSNTLQYIFTRDYKKYFRQYTSLNGWSAWEDLTNLNKRIDKYGVFGIELNHYNNHVKRISLALGLKYGQQVGSTVETSDFDNVFPWCDMKECNIEFSGSTPVITYKGDLGFSRNKDTFIEIPKFYFKREIDGTKERWYVSGTKASGFVVEPWFLDENGDEVDYRYIAKYAGCDFTNTHVSITGQIPQRSKTKAQCIANYEGKGFKLASVQAYLAIMHLMAIEYGTFDSQSINPGISYYPYSSHGECVCTNNGSSNTVRLPYHIRNTYFEADDIIYFSDSISGDLTTSRNVVSVDTDGSSYVDITFDGNPITFVSGTTRAYGSAQPTGKCDSLTYVNGRTEGIKYTRPFIYRGIENIYGNTGELMDRCDYSNANEKISVDGTDMPFTTPRNQSYISEQGTSVGFITGFGFKRGLDAYTLPSVLNGTYDTPFYDEWSTMATGEECAMSYGCGWDHWVGNGVFCLRAVNKSESSWLYGSRAEY